MSILYKLVIKNNQKEQEEGFFFKASPFEIQHKNTCISCKFEHNKHHEAVLNCYLEDRVILEVEHPFYLPDTEPGIFFKKAKNNELLELIIHALLSLEISKLKSYEAYFNDLQKHFNYEVIQGSFYNIEQ